MSVIYINGNYFVFSLAIICISNRGNTESKVVENADISFPTVGSTVYGYILK